MAKKIYRAARDGTVSVSEQPWTLEPLTLSEQAAFWVAAEQPSEPVKLTTTTTTEPTVARLPGQYL